MPQAPLIPMQSPTAVPQQASPTSYLMAAADMHNSGALQQAVSAPVPRGHDLQTGKAPGRHHKLKVLK